MITNTDLFGIVIDKVQIYELINSGEIKIYFSSFLKSLLDGFMANYISDFNYIPWVDGNLTETQILNYTNQYINLQLLTPDTVTTEDASYISDYQVQANFYDAHSLIISISKDLTPVRNEYMPISDNTPTNGNIQTKAILKNLDLDLSSQYTNSPYIQYLAIESDDKPIDILNGNSLKDLSFSFSIVTFNDVEIFLTLNISSDLLG